MITEKGELLVGVEYGGKIHTAFELRPQLVRDSVEIFEGEDIERAKKNDAFFAVCLLAKQIVKLGELPKEAITPELLLNLCDADFKRIDDACKALNKRLLFFRAQGKKPEKADSGDAKNRV